ncbi:MAG: RNA polymerase sigma factor [Acidimicrobiia bacterium]
MLSAQDVERFRSGDADAVRPVYAEFGRLVFAVSMRVLGQRELAEEAVQQTFVQAWRSASTFEPDREMAPWLVTIARRAAIDIQRRERRRAHVALDDAPAGDSSLVALPPSAEQIDTVWRVREAIDALPAGERELVRLQHLEGMSQSEIAERLDLPIGTVKSRSFRAHRMLAAQLGHLREAAHEDDS